MQRCFLALVLSLPVIACAEPLSMRMCVDTEPHLPYLTATLGGSAGELVSRAAQQTGVTIALRPAPLVRCREELRADKADAFPALAYRQLPFMVYPTRGGQADVSAAVGRTSYMVFRRTGTQVGWDGKRFNNLHKPALLASGAVAPLRRLTALRVQADDNGKTLRANFDKLLAGRGDICVGFRREGQALMALPEYAGKIEMLPRSLLENNYYLAFTDQFYRTNKAAADAMWQAIRRDNARAPSVQSAEARVK